MPRIIARLRTGKEPDTVTFVPDDYEIPLDFVEIGRGYELPTFPKNHIWNGAALEYSRELWLNREIRPERNRRLKDTDAYVLPDVDTKLTAAQRQALRTYRQQLRDLPAVIDESYPQWPDRPNFVKDEDGV